MQNQQSCNTQDKGRTTSSSHFIQGIWQQKEMVDLYDQIVMTRFNQGLKKGDLNPIFFTKFMVQEVAYQNQSLELWQKASEDGKQDQQFFELCLKFKGLQEKLTESVKKDITLQTVEPIPATRAYINYKQQAYSRQTYHYIFIVNYICYKLYVRMYGKMAAEISQPNVYSEWILQYISPELLTLEVEIQQTINSYQCWFDRERVKQDLIRIMEIQLYFWKAMTGEAVEQQLQKQ